MQKINKTNNTYLGMAFLFLSLAITPFSLKAVGISPNLFAGLDAWRQISSVFGDNHQPVTSSELLALNNVNSGEDTGADREIGIQQFMAAQLQVESAEASVPAASDAHARTAAASNQQKPCPKSAPRPARVAGTSESASVVISAIEAHAQRVEAAARPEVIINKSALRNFQRQLTRHKFEIGEVMKIVPIRDLDVLVKLKGMNIAFPILPKCDSRKPQPREQVKETRLRASREQVESATLTAPENCEL